LFSGASNEQKNDKYPGAELLHPARVEH